MSNSSDPKDLTYPDKPDSNGYAKKYFKRRAYYFGAHNSPESFMLFGEWKRRLVETGSAPEVKKLRKELAQQAIPSPHLHLSAPVERNPLQLATLAGAAFLLFFAAVLVSAKILSSKMGPTVDGISLTNEEIDFIRGVRLYYADRGENRWAEGERVADLTMKLMEEGPVRGKDYLSKTDI